MTDKGTLELRIHRFSDFAANECQLYSDPTYIHGVVWRIGVKPSGKPKTRLVFLECTGGDDFPNWSCKASATFRFVSQSEGLDDEIIETNHDFSKESYSRGLSMLNLNPHHCFIKDNTAIIRVHVKAKVPQSVRIAKLSKFASSISDSPDGVLIVGWMKQRIPIHKTYLSYCSEYFKTMFRSEFKEGREDEIVLEDVEYEEMIELLAVTYPSNAPIAAWNIKTILKLADRFIMPVILERCKKELRISTINGAQKLLLTEMYNFEDLQLEFAQQYRTAEDLIKLRSEPGYNQLDNKTCRLVMNSIAY